MEPTKKVVLFEPDEKLRELMIFSLESRGHIKVIPHQDLQVLAKWILENNKFDLVVLGNSESSELGKFILFCRDHRVPQPIFYHSMKAFAAVADLVDVFHFPDPLELEDFVFSIREKIDLGAKSLPKFVPLRFELLNQIGVLKSPVYVRLNDSKFVKVAAEDSRFEEERVERFKKKGASELYLDSSDAEQFIHEYKRACLSDFAWNTIQTTELTDSVRISLDLMKTLSDRFGWSASIVDLAYLNIQRSLALASRHSEFKKVLSHFKRIERFGFADHITMCSLVSIGISEKLVERFEDASRILTFASVFHDAVVPLDLWKEHRQLMNSHFPGQARSPLPASELSDHPTRSASLIHRWEWADTRSGTIIQNHHEFPSFNGYPKGLESSQLDQLTKIFMVAEEFVFQFQEKNGALTNEDFLKLIPEYLKDENFSFVRKLF